MGSLSIWHWLIVLLVILVLFGGRGKVSGLMGDFASGIKAFKKNMADDDASMETSEAERPAPPISGPAAKQTPARDTAAAARETATARHE